MAGCNPRKLWTYYILGYSYKGKIYVTNIDDKCFGTNKKKNSIALL